MKNFTAKRYLDEAYSILREKQSSDHEVVDPVLIEAMRAYALQEVKKNLVIAADKAETKESIKHSAIYDAIDKESIINIQINLT